MYRIIVLEDQPTIRLALEYQLKKVFLDSRHEEPQIVLCPTLDVFERTIARDRSFGLAVIDLGLPVSGGFDVDAGFGAVDEMESSEPPIPSIILTVRNDKRAFDRAGEYSCARYFITKPWDHKRLIAAAEACLRGSATGLELIGHVEGQHG